MAAEFLHSLQRYARMVFGTVFGLRVTGVERVPPTGGLLIASNHISEMDPPVLGSSIPRTLHFMAKSELFHGRIPASFFLRLNAFPVNRRGVDRGALRTSETILLSGGALLMFPEGTRSNDGRPLPPKPGIGMIVSRTGVPVLPAFIHGTNRPLSAIFRNPRFTVSLGLPIWPREIASAGSTGDFASIAALIMDRIAETGAEAGLTGAERRIN